MNELEVKWFEKPKGKSFKPKFEFTNLWNKYNGVVIISIKNYPSFFFWLDINICILNFNLRIFFKRNGKYKISE